MNRLEFNIKKIEIAARREMKFLNKNNPYDMKYLHMFIVQKLEKCLIEAEDAEDLANQMIKDITGE